MRVLNSSGLRKKYSTPLRSVPRGARLVALTEKCKFSPRSMRYSMSVFLPEPEGPEKVITFVMVERGIRGR